MKFSKNDTIQVNYASSAYLFTYGAIPLFQHASAKATKIIHDPSNPVRPLTRQSNWQFSHKNKPAKSHLLNISWTSPRKTKWFQRPVSKQFFLIKLKFLNPNSATSKTATLIVYEKNSDNLKTFVFFTAQTNLWYMQSLFLFLLNFLWIWPTGLLALAHWLAGSLTPPWLSITCHWISGFLALWFSGFLDFWTCGSAGSAPYSRVLHLGGSVSVQNVISYSFG